MKKIAVITGGAGGMGFAAAKILGNDHHLIICDLDKDRLIKAIAELEVLGISCESALLDITDRTRIDAMFLHANNQGSFCCVIHTAGISPQMADGKTIMRVNALGTINITEAALAIASDGFALVNVASMSAHLLPGILVPKRAYRHAFGDTQTLLKKAVLLSRLMPTPLYRNGMAYAISKHFVIWYSKKMAKDFGKKGARIVTVSPGSFDTEMGRLEEKSGSGKMLTKAALNRFGKPEEIAEVLAFCASAKASYMTGVDILCDGGVVTGNSIR